MINRKERKGFTQSTQRFLCALGAFSAPFAVKKNNKVYATINSTIR